MSAPAVILTLAPGEVVLLAAAAATLADAHAAIYDEACKVIGPIAALELLPDPVAMRALADRLADIAAHHDAGD